MEESDSLVPHRITRRAIISPALEPILRSSLPEWHSTTVRDRLHKLFQDTPPKCTVEDLVDTFRLSAQDEAEINPILDNAEEDFHREAVENYIELVLLEILAKSSVELPSLINTQGLTKLAIKMLHVRLGERFFNTSDETEYERLARLALTSTLKAHHSDIASLENIQTEQQRIDAIVQLLQDSESPLRATFGSTFNIFVKKTFPNSFSTHETD